MSNLILNVNDNKKAKGDNLKSSCSWNCLLGHVSERRMTELHNWGSLGSFDCESFDKCESHLLGKDERVALYGKGWTCLWTIRPNTFICLWSFVH